MPSLISEDDLERALLQVLSGSYGYETLNALTEDPSDLQDGTNRKSKRDVVLEDRLLEAALRLNPGIPLDTIEGALETITDKRQAMAPLAANEELYGFIRDGVPVEYEDKDGHTQQGRVRVIDFRSGQDPTVANRFLAVQQMWIEGERYQRPDVILFVNGIPLVFVELKNSKVKLKTAYTKNLTNYRERIPQLFVPNAFCVLSNGVRSRVGSTTAGWEHFFKWLRPDDESETVDTEKIRERGTSLERVIEGLFPPARLLDYVENFLLYFDGQHKIIAQNHQFIGVNKAYASFQQRSERDGKLGVFWHTQGSGKSFSMIFLVRKVFRKETGNFTFVVVTDRDDLDGQIYGNFLKSGTVKKSDAAQPIDGDQLYHFLGQNKRLVFTLIQKFRKAKCASRRSDIVVLVDEAHRTQYKTFAENMRVALPNAQYMAFTGTPLLGRDRKTNAWFGDYVSEYNFRQAMDDDATVPLFYEKRVPEMVQQNEDLSDEFYQLLEDEHLDEAQQEKLENRYAREMEVIKRDDRLEAVAKDIAYHFPRRGYLGKGLVVTVDKYTAVTMYHKVQRHWKEAVKELRGQIRKAKGTPKESTLRRRLDYMRSVEMAVVISPETGEEEAFRDRELDIKPHRDRMNALDERGHDIEYNFKDPSDPLQLVFVCAMWLTGFDAPTLSTLYLDKPMKGHTLMQTIARANRVTSWVIENPSGQQVPKTHGELVDYFNVFRNMRSALRDYADGDNGSGSSPVREKGELFSLLDEATEEGFTYCEERGIDLRSALAGGDVLGNTGRLAAFADRLLKNDDWRQGFNVHENLITALYEACKPEIIGRPVARKVAAFQQLRGVVDSIVHDADLDAVGRQVAELLDESLVTAGADLKKDLSSFRIERSGEVLDLRTLDAAHLREGYKCATHKHIQIADLRAFIEQKMADMLRRNGSRIDFAQRLQRIIDRYNAGSSSTDNYFEELVRFAEALRSEDERHIREGLTEEELEVFDLLKKDGLTKDETQSVKLAARELLSSLRSAHSSTRAQGWHRDSQSRLRVQGELAEVLNLHLPEDYGKDEFREKCAVVYDLAVARNGWALGRAA